MKHRLSILPRAAADIDEQALYIAQDSVEAAIRFDLAVLATLKQIQKNPYLGSLCELEFLPDLRRRGVRGFVSHLIFYRIVGERVIIVRILHGARDIESTLTDASPDS